MEEEDKQGPFFLFYIFLCVRMWCLVQWQLSLHHEDRSKSIAGKLTQNPVIGELLKAPQSHSNSFFCETNKTFISKPPRFWLFCFLKLNIYSQLHVYNSYTFLLEWKLHEDRDQAYFTPDYSDCNTMEVYFSLTQSLSYYDGCMMLSCEQAPFMLLLCLP